MNLTNEQISQSVMNIHLQVELHKLSGLSPQEAVNNEYSTVDMIGEIGKVVNTLGMTEIDIVSNQITVDLNSVITALDLAIVIIKTDVNGAATNIKLDVDYAIEYITASKNEMNKRMEAINNLFDERRKLLSNVKKPILLS